MDGDARFHGPERRMPLLLWPLRASQTRRKIEGVIQAAQVLRLTFLPAWCFSHHLLRESFPETFVSLRSGWTCSAGPHLRSISRLKPWRWRRCLVCDCVRTFSESRGQNRGRILRDRRSWEELYEKSRAAIFRG